jgi:hypothetical protein
MAPSTWRARAVGLYREVVLVDERLFTPEGWVKKTLKVTETFRV